MKAAVLFGQANLQVREWHEPTLEAGDVLIRVAQCGICGSDLRTYFRGPSPRYALPGILGHEFVGTIAEVNSNPNSFEIGARVTAAPAIPCGECSYCRRGEDNLCRNLLDFGINFDGGFAEFVRVPARLVRRGGLVKLSDSYTDALAIWGEPVGTVLHAQRRAQVSAGQTVVVIGDGPIGLLHVLVAKHLGAAKVFVLGHHEERLRVAREVGATLATSDGAEIIESADVVIVAVSEGAALTQAFDFVRDGGMIVAFGGSSRDAQISISPYRLHYGEVKLIGSFNCTTDDFRRAIDLIPQLNLAPLTPRVVSLDEIEQGFSAAYAREAIKVAVEIN